MVKLASARASRTYGPRPARDRWECINAGAYLLAAALLVGGFAAQLSPALADAKYGLVAALVALALFLAVNAHDLVAHLAGIDYCLALAEFDVQLALVEFAVPLLHVAGIILTFVGILVFSTQMEKGYSHRLENHAVNTLIGGAVFWVIGSIHSVCQVYERSDNQVQILQKSVQVPLLMGSMLFLVAAILNKHDVFGSNHPTFKIFEKSWVWLCLSGSSLFFVGGLFNVVKVFKMQNVDGVRLEKLRGAARERLAKERESQVPLTLEDNRRRKQFQEVKPVPVPPSIPTPYKDALLRSQAKCDV